MQLFVTFVPRRKTVHNWNFIIPWILHVFMRCRHYLIEFSLGEGHDEVGQPGECLSRPVGLADEALHAPRVLLGLRQQSSQILLVKTATCRLHRKTPHPFLNNSSWKGQWQWHDNDGLSINFHLLIGRDLTLREGSKNWEWRRIYRETDG